MPQFDFTSHTVALGLLELVTKKSTRNLPWEEERGQRARISSSSVSRLSGKCGSNDGSYSYGPPLPVTKLVSLSSSKPKSQGSPS
jgi:hypothetical protein